MGRYSPTVRLDPGGPLDFTALSSALRELQDTRLRKRQQKLWEEREAEHRRQQGERERIAAEARANDVRARGGVKLLEAPMGQPTLRDLTPSRAPRVPEALGGGELRPMLPRSTGGDPRPDGTGRYLEVVDGESYMVDPMQPLRLQERVRQDTERAKLASSGRVARTLLSNVPTYRGALDQLNDEDLGRMPLSEIDALTRAGTPKPLSARDDIDGQARALGLNVSGMSPGEASQRVAMAERTWENANRPRSSDDESRALLREERTRKAREALASRVVRAAKARGHANMRDLYGDKAIWNPRDAADAKRLGMTHGDYLAAWQAYEDSPSTSSARAARGGGTNDVQTLIAKALEGEAPGEPTEDDFVRALQALGPNASEAQARAWLAKNRR